MGLHLTKYYYDNVFTHCRQWVRVYSEEQGANGKVVLEDVINILLAQTAPTLSFDVKEDFKYTDEVLTSTLERIKLAEITPVSHNGLHLADVEELLEFYAFCDDLSNPDIFETFGDWLNFQVCSLIIKRLAHLGHIVSQIPSWEKYQSRVGITFDKEEKASIRDWLKKCYGLNVDWVIDIFVYKFRNRMSSGYTVNTGDKPDINENKNVYPLTDFALIYQSVEWMLTGSDNWKWLTESLDKTYVQKKVNAAKNQIKSLIKSGRSEDEIIKTIWDVTPTSNIVEDQNYQYGILKAFINIVA